MPHAVPTQPLPESPDAPAENRSPALITAALPWMISLLAHVMLFMLLALIVWVVQATAQVRALPVAEARIDSATTEELPGAASKPDLNIQQDVVPIQAEALSNASFDLLSEFSDPNQESLSIIGIGAGAAGGDMAQYGIESGSLGEGPSFFGLGSDASEARKICYIVDRSGSMVEELGYVKDEVIRSVSRLHRSQQYHIMFFSGGPAIEAPPRDFVYAIKDYKSRSFAFLKTIEAAGSTDPVPAMARAFKLEADLIYFLTDGEFPEELVDKLRVWNADKTVRIYTIAFIGRNGERLLRQIAQENGGDFKFVSWDDLH